VRCEADHPERIELRPADVERIRAEAALLVPALAGARLRARWGAVRPLDSDGSDDFVVIDHSQDVSPTGGFVTIAGGPTTTMRATAQAGADLICRRLGVERPCETMDTILLPHATWYSR
jgi:glycerol-3-phosphate dehydrogenase